MESIDLNIEISLWTPLLCLLLRLKPFLSIVLPRVALNFCSALACLPFLLWSPKLPSFALRVLYSLVLIADLVYSSIKVV